MKTLEFQSLKKKNTYSDHFEQKFLKINFSNKDEFHDEQDLNFYKNK